MPSFVHTILVHRQALSRYILSMQYFVQTILVQRYFGPLISVFQVCSPNTVGTKTFWSMIHFVWLISIVQLYFVLFLSFMELFFHKLMFLSLLHFVQLCPASSYFRNSFTKPLNPCILIICSISQYSQHHHRPSAHTEHTFSLEVTDVITIMLVHQWPRPIFFDLICIDFHVW